MNRFAHKGFSLSRLLIALLLGTMIFSACSAPQLPEIPELPDLSQLPSLPGIPENLRDIPDLLGQLGLPDLSTIPNLPQLEDLPGLQTPAGAIVFNGPTERQINIGDQLPGTDIRLTNVSAEGAEFQIAGMRSVRAVGDSLDFDGAWPGANGVDYNLRMRIYYTGGSYVRAAGVHRFVIYNIQPTRANVTLSGNTMKFPFTVGVSQGGTIAGTTLGYAGMEDRGGQITGLPEGEYPFRKIGDSIQWKGYVRSDIPADFAIRMLYYDASGARVGGVVTLLIPSNQ
ncbi:MAG: hypothetical protein KF832_09990 [Caldilineaceae bacterium]|nr:hypothetical protein [Caldilineaceae bacterium]